MIVISEQIQINRRANLSPSRQLYSLGSRHKEDCDICTGSEYFWRSRLFKGLNINGVGPEADKGEV